MNEFLPYLYFLGAAIFLGSIYFLGEKKPGQNLYHPMIMFAAFYSLVFFILPGTAILTNIVDTSITPQTEFICFLFLMVFGACVYGVFFWMGGQKSFIEGRELAAGNSHWKLLDPKLLTTTCIIVLLPSFASFAWQLIQIKQNGGFSRYLAKRILLNQGEGYVQMPNQWFLVILAIFLANALVNRNKNGVKPNWVIIGLLTAASAFTAGMQASRTRLLLPFVIIAMTLAILRQTNLQKKIPTIRYVIAGIIIVVTGVVLGPVRQAIMGSKTQHVVKAISKLSSTQTAIESFNEYEHVWWLVEHQNTYEPLGGQTYLAIAAGLIPRRYWPEKPIGGGPMLLNLKNPGSYEIGSEKTHSPITPGVPAEGVMNFGLWGFPIMGMVYGLLLGLIVRYLPRVNNAFLFALWITIAEKVVEGLHGEAFGVASAIFITIIPVFMAMGLYKLLLRMGTEIAANLRAYQASQRAPKGGGV